MCTLEYLNLSPCEKKIPHTTYFRIVRQQGKLQIGKVLMRILAKPLT